MEIWKDIVGYEGFYVVSNLGRVMGLARKHNRRTIKAKFLHPSSCDDGYVRCTLFRDKTARSKYVHRLVAMAFIPNPENKPQVNHIDGDKTNNRIENLEWCTSKENHDHERVLGRQRIGERNPAAKLTPADILEIRRLLALRWKPKVIAYKVKVNVATIYEIKQGRRWAHIK